MGRKLTKAFIYIAISDALQAAGFHGRLAYDAAVAGKLAVDEVLAKANPNFSGHWKPEGTRVNMPDMREWLRDQHAAEMEGRIAEAIRGVVGLSQEDEGERERIVRLFTPRVAAMVAAVGRFAYERGRASIPGNGLAEDGSALEVALAALSGEKP